MFICGWMTLLFQLQSVEFKNKKTLNLGT